MNQFEPNNEFNEQEDVDIGTSEGIDEAWESVDCTEDEMYTPKTRTVRLSTMITSCVVSFLIGITLIVLFVPNSLRLWFGGGSVLDKISAIGQIIDDHYIYADQIDDKAMEDMLAWGYVYGLGDEYAYYYNAEQYSELQQSNAGQSYGIGINGVYYGEKNGIYIASVTVDAPADAAGIKKGDIITAVDGQNVTASNYSALMSAIRGEKGTTVVLDILRPNSDATQVEVERGEFTATSVWGEMIGEVGYIKITTFNEATVAQFNKVLDSHLEAGATALVFDLRGNTGGLVNSASAMLDRLLPECDLGYAVYQGGERKVLAQSDKERVELPMTVIVDGSTASSSEYFAAAMSDVAGATLIGNTTYGKGIMQTTYPLGDGSAVRVTVAEIYSPDGNRYHGVGLAPDVEVNYTEEQQKTWFLLEGAADPYIYAALEEVRQ